MAASRDALRGSCAIGEDQPVAPPAIVIVDPDPRALEALERHVRDRYGGDYRLVATTSADAALRVCDELREGGEAVALVLAADDVAGVPGARLLASTRAAHPDAGRVLVTTNVSVEAAVLAVNETGLHGYVVRPCAAPETQLYPVLDDVLDDWRARDATPYLVVEKVMDTGDAVVRIASDATLLDAARMVAVTRTSYLMVVEDDDRFVGVLAEGDILRNALPDFEEITRAGGTLHDAYQLFVKKARALSALPIGPLVIRDPIVLEPTDHVAQAATILIERQIRRLPVVDDGRLVGTVSRANICRTVVGRA